MGVTGLIITQRFRNPDLSRASAGPQRRETSMGSKKYEVVDQLIVKRLLSLVFSGLDWDSGSFYLQGIKS